MSLLISIPRPRMPDLITEALHGFTTHFVHDGIGQSSSDIHAAAAGLARTLEASPHARVALATLRVGVMATALLACETARCELLLLREAPAIESPLWTLWGVDAILTDALTLTPLGEQGRARSSCAVFLTTSGTTGSPKVARHSLERLFGRVRAPRRDQARPTWLLTYHPAAFAGLQVLLTALAAGGRLVSTRDKDAATLAHAALSNGATHISGTPTFWRALLMALGGEAEKVPLRQITLGGEATDQTILNRLSATFPNASVTHVYASTEAGALFAVHDRRTGFPSRWLSESVDGVDLRIREGLLEVRSPRAMEAYVVGTGHGPLTEDGWLATNDLAEQRGDRVVFLGRADSVINVGGAKVGPDEVEAVLLEVPGVAETRVSGLANPITGQIVAADVVLSPGYSDRVVRRSILEHARHSLVAYKVPRIVRFVDAIVYSSAGKKSRQS